MAKLWEGRFSGGLAPDMEAFQNSIGFDSRLWEEDVSGSMAHAAMLGRQGIIGEDEAKVIVLGLEGIAADLRSGTLRVDLGAEDIHSFVEAELTRRIGEAGKKVHTGRSRNDQVALDFRLYAKGALDALEESLRDLGRAILSQAESHADTVMPGYTHVQRAQPVSLAHHLLAWVEMLLRDIGRVRDARARADECPLGAGALAASGFPLDRDFVATALGFPRVTANSLDSVSDRDYAIETVSACSIIMVHLSRMAEELVLWSSAEFGLVELDDAYSTGSSMMPQKKNPDSAELVRGKAGRVFGDLVALLAMMKALPLAYNKDMQEDKEQTFDAVDTTLACLRVMAGAVSTMRPRVERMREAAGYGYMNATDLADYLVAKGMPFRDTHAVAAKLVRRAIAAGKRLEDLGLDELKSESGLFEADVYEAIGLDACLAKRRVKGGPAPERVREALSAARERLG